MTDLNPEKLNRLNPPELEVPADDDTEHLPVKPKVSGEIVVSKEDSGLSEVPETSVPLQLDSLSADRGLVEADKSPSTLSAFAAELKKTVNPAKKEKRIIESRSDETA